jgi:Tetracyclin repressor-like, C-terminal domain
VRADLVAGIATLVRSLSGTALGRVLPALVADLANDADLAAEFRDRVFDPRRESTAITLRSAIARGDIRSDIDFDYVLDAPTGAPTLLSRSLSPKAPRWAAAGCVSGSRSPRPSSW